MNNKGFTFIELMAVIVVLSIIGTVSITVSINLFNNYKENSKKVFLGRVADVTEEYLSLNDDLTYSKYDYCLSKVADKDQNSTKKVTLEKSENHSFEGMESYFSKPFRNPVSKKMCSYTDSYFYVYKDADMVKYIALHLVCDDEVLEESYLPEVSSCE